jgi:hypothetical protein
MPKILKLQRIGDGIGVILDVSFLSENGAVRLLDGLELLCLRQEHEKVGAQQERERLDDEGRAREVHAELNRRLRDAHDLLADCLDACDDLARDLRSFLDKEDPERE